MCPQHLRFCQSSQVNVLNLLLSNLYLGTHLKASLHHSFYRVSNVWWYLIFFAEQHFEFAPDNEDAFVDSPHIQVFYALLHLLFSNAGNLFCNRFKITKLRLWKCLNTPYSVQKLSTFYFWRQKKNFLFTSEIFTFCIIFCNFTNIKDIELKFHTNASNILGTAAAACYKYFTCI